MNWFWVRQAERFSITDGEIRIVSQPRTDLWQRTYYGFRNDNSPVLLTKTDERYFSFVTRTDFDSAHRFDQCGVVIYQDSDNWFKASIEYENAEFQRLGSVVTNGGYSDWATADIPARVRTMWYRLSRRESDYCVECSEDGVNFRQMRIFHLSAGAGEISIGLYACSPEDSSFTARFTGTRFEECKWAAHS